MFLFGVELGVSKLSKALLYVLLSGLDYNGAALSAALITIFGTFCNCLRALLSPTVRLSLPEAVNTSLVLKVMFLEKDHRLQGRKAQVD